MIILPCKNVQTKKTDAHEIIGGKLTIARPEAKIFWKPAHVTIGAQRVEYGDTSLTETFRVLTPF